VFLKFWKFCRKSQICDLEKGVLELCWTATIKPRQIDRSGFFLLDHNGQIRVYRLVSGQSDERKWLKLLDFYYLSVDTRFQEKKNKKISGGNPYFGPPKPVTDQKWPRMTTNNPPILMQNLFLHKKWGCLQKTRALYLKKWLSYGHVKIGKIKSQNFWKIGSAEKIAITRSIFEVSLKFFFLVVTDGPL